MKTIFVTVQEFLENGGVLELGRYIFNSSGGMIGIYDGTFTDKIFHGMSRIKRSVGTFPSYNSLTFVEIETTPIYK